MLLAGVFALLVAVAVAVPPDNAGHLPVAGALERAGSLALTQPPARAVPVVGDWDGDGTETPGLVTGNQWRLYPELPEVDPAVFHYGRSGDVPVVGDWDGDGTDTPGVRRGSQWLLRNATSAGAASISFHYGRSTDVPVVGDWDGDGIETPGVRRGSQWLLRNAASGGAASVVFHYGRSSDVPVVGDWDGDGTDTPGVRRGSQWLLRNATSAGAASISFHYGRSSDVPVVGDWDGDGTETPGVERSEVFHMRQQGSGGAADLVLGEPCPAAVTTPGAPDDPARLVEPPEQLDRPMAVAEGPASQTRIALGNATRYLLGSGFQELWAGRLGSASYLDIRGDAAGYSATEHALRPPLLGASAVAVALRTDGLGREVDETGRAAAVTYARALIRSAACQHASNTPGGWPTGSQDWSSLAEVVAGERSEASGLASSARTAAQWARSVPATWQAAHWAFLGGLGGWLMWDQLNPHEQTYIARMVEWEANRVAAGGARWWQAASGSIVAPGDTKMEELTWDTNILQLASAMMPAHPNRSDWQEARVRNGLTATAVLADTTAETTVMGRELGDWVGGANVYPDGTLDNHGIHGHPDYMSAVRQSWLGALVAGLADQPTPRSDLWNGDLVYGALSTVPFTAGVQYDLYPDNPGTRLAAPNAEPGGTIYRAGTSEVYYPNASIWVVWRGPASSLSTPWQRCSTWMAALRFPPPNGQGCTSRGSCRTRPGSPMADPSRVRASSRTREGRSSRPTCWRSPGWHSTWTLKAPSQWWTGPWVGCDRPMRRRTV